MYQEDVVDGVRAWTIPLLNIFFIINISSMILSHITIRPPLFLSSMSCKYGSPSFHRRATDISIVTGSFVIAPVPIFIGMIGVDDRVRQVAGAVVFLICISFALYKWFEAENKMIKSAYF